MDVEIGALVKRRDCAGRTTILRVESIGRKTITFRDENGKRLTRTADIGKPLSLALMGYEVLPDGRG